MSLRNIVVLSTILMIAVLVMGAYSLFEFDLRVVKPLKRYIAENNIEELSSIVAGLKVAETLMFFAIASLCMVPLLLLMISMLAADVRKLIQAIEVLQQRRSDR